MKSKIFFLSLLLFCFIFPLEVKGAQLSEEQILQKTEIMKQELSLLRSLFLNLLAVNQGAKITALSYLAVDLPNNSVLLEQNSNLSYPIASITKLMTAVIALEEIDLSQEIILTEEILEPSGYSPSLYPGLKVNAENLLKATLIQSTNDAAEALSCFIRKEKFVELMNQKAKELNMKGTVFYDPHGLNPSNRSTTQDLSKLLRYIYKNHPEILNISRDNNFWLPDASGKLLKFRNVNSFYHFPNFIGGKAGYLLEARETFASIFNVKGNTVAIIILYSNNHQADIFSILKRLQ